MVISQTPLRLEITGGGSDLPAFYKHQLGAIVNVAINQYIYVAVNHLSPLFPVNYFIKTDKVEKVKKLDQIQNPLIKETLKLLKVKNLDLSVLSDLPSGNGLGSSGSFVVGLLNSLTHINQEPVSPEKLAQTALHIEKDLVKIKCGGQDQYAAALGGLRIHQFKEDDSVSSKVIKCSSTTLLKLEKRLLLFYTGTGHSAAKFLDNLCHQLSTNPQKRQLMAKRVTLSQLIAKDLGKNSLTCFADYFDEDWQLKKAIAPNETNEKIDYYYNLAKKNGALAGKLVGAGGGGFLLFYAKEENQEKIIKALKKLQFVPFHFDPQGSRIIYS